MIRIPLVPVASAAVVVALGASYGRSIATANDSSAPAATVTYGPAVALGEGMARTYVVKDPKTGAPVEIGVALGERALDGLPTAGSGHHGGHEMPHTYLIDLPEGHGTPFTFLEMNWNPAGHEPEGVYQDMPHFDFHFYTVSKAVRESIVPSNPKFAELANKLPADEYVPEFNRVMGPPGVPPAGVAVPMMGVHWADVRSPELQGILGNPAGFKPFTATFIHGSWDGQFHFWEPMITRAHIVEKKTATDPAVRDQVIPVPTAKRHAIPGYYPSAYRIAWDPEAKEYRIALTQLARRD